MAATVMQWTLGAEESCSISVWLEDISTQIDKDILTARQKAELSNVQEHMSKGNSFIFCSRLKKSHKLITGSSQFDVGRYTNMDLKDDVTGNSNDSKIDINSTREDKKVINDSEEKKMDNKIGTDKASEIAKDHDLKTHSVEEDESNSQNNGLKSEKGNKGKIKTKLQERNASDKKDVNVKEDMTVKMINKVHLKNIDKVGAINGEKHEIKKDVKLKNKITENNKEIVKIVDIVERQSGIEDNKNSNTIKENENITYKKEEKKKIEKKTTSNIRELEKNENVNRPVKETKKPSKKGDGKIKKFKTIEIKETGIDKNSELDVNISLSDDKEKEENGKSLASPDDVVANIIDVTDETETFDDKIEDDNKMKGTKEITEADNEVKIDLKTATKKQNIKNIQKVSKEKTQKTVKKVQRKENSKLKENKKLTAKRKFDKMPSNDNEDQKENENIIDDEDKTSTRSGANPSSSDGRNDEDETITNKSVNGKDNSGNVLNMHNKVEEEFEDKSTSINGIDKTSIADYEGKNGAHNEVNMTRTFENSTKDERDKNEEEQNIVNENDSGRQEDGEKDDMDNEEIVNDQSQISEENNQKEGDGEENNHNKMIKKKEDDENRTTIGFDSETKERNENKHDDIINETNANKNDTFDEEDKSNKEYHEDNEPENEASRNDNDQVHDESNNIGVKEVEEIKTNNHKEVKKQYRDLKATKEIYDKIERRNDAEKTTILTDEAAEQEEDQEFDYDDNNKTNNDKTSENNTTIEEKKGKEHGTVKENGNVYNKEIEVQEDLEKEGIRNKRNKKIVLPEIKANETDDYSSKDEGKNETIGDDESGRKVNKINVYKEDDTKTTTGFDLEEKKNNESVKTTKKTIISDDTMKIKINNENIISEESITDKIIILNEKTQTKENNGKTEKNDVDKNRNKENNKIENKMPLKNKGKGKKKKGDIKKDETTKEETGEKSKNKKENFRKQVKEPQEKNAIEKKKNVITEKGFGDENMSVENGESKFKASEFMDNDKKEDKKIGVLGDLDKEEVFDETNVMSDNEKTRNRQSKIELREGMTNEEEISESVESKRIETIGREFSANKTAPQLQTVVDKGMGENLDEKKEESDAKVGTDVIEKIKTDDEGKERRYKELSEANSGRLCNDKAKISNLFDEKFKMFEEKFKKELNENNDFVTQYKLTQEKQSEYLNTRLLHLERKINNMHRVYSLLRERGKVIVDLKNRLRTVESRIVRLQGSLYHCENRYTSISHQVSLRLNESRNLEIDFRNHYTDSIMSTVNRTIHEKVANVGEETLGKVMTYIWNYQSVTRDNVASDLLVSYENERCRFLRSIPHIPSCCTNSHVTKSTPSVEKIKEKNYKDCNSIDKERVISVDLPLGRNKLMSRLLCRHKSVVMLQRTSGNINFTRNWEDYKYGFGDLNDSFWIGLEVLHQLTNTAHYRLLVELQDWDNVRYNGTYDHFKVDSELNGYQLNIDGFHGNCGDGLSAHHSSKFSTLDVDNDDAVVKFGGSCSNRFRGGWWYYSCYKCNPTGVYYDKGKVEAEKFDGVSWKPLRPPTYSFQRMVMSLQRVATSA